jgi:hypothetical protein
MPQPWGIMLHKIHTHLDAKGDCCGMLMGWQSLFFLGIGEISLKSEIKILKKKQK